MTARLYECRITHARTAPIRNVFSYRSYLWLVDLDQLPSTRLLARFSARDHLGDPRRGIRDNLENFLGTHRIDLGGGRVMMLAHARGLGYVFNPLTVYWCHRADGTLACVVAEVHNTYGHWDAYFAALDQHLAPGGRIGLQTITMPNDRMLATRRTYTWIQKYIFPGGLLPSVAAIESSLARATRLRITASEDFGAHYAQTLKIWRKRFGARAEEVARLGFDEVFSRMWNFYLCYSEAGFRAGYIGVSQLTLART